MSPDIKTDDWAVLKVMKASQSFQLLINEECLTQLAAKNNRLWYGERKAKIKVFRNEPRDNIQKEVDDTSGLLGDLLLSEKRSRVALDNLLVLLREGDIDIDIIQEPWTRDYKVMGLTTTEYETFYLNTEGKPRACLLISYIFKTLLIPSLCNGDLAVVKIVLSRPYQHQWNGSSNTRRRIE